MVYLNIGIFFLFFSFKIFYLFLAALGLSCSMWDLFVAAHGLFFAAHGLLSSCGMRVFLSLVVMLRLQSTWSL